jgi:hypothetical protein
MRKKKISKKNPSTNSGWLLEAGIIGIDKVLKILKIAKINLLELEQILRENCFDGVTFSEKKKLPWRKIPIPSWQKEWKSPPAEFLVPFEKYCDKIVKEKGRKLTNDEWDEIHQDWHHHNYAFPGEYELFDLLSAFEIDEDIKKRKGRGPTSERKPLSKRILNAETLKLFRAGVLDNDTERKKLNRIKKHSMVLGNALDIIANWGRVKFRCPSDCYPEKVKEIISLSLSSLKRRNEFLKQQKEFNAKRIVQIEELLIKNKKERDGYLSELKALKDSLEKSGEDD